MSKQYREKMGEVVRLIINLIEKYPSTNGKVVVDHISNELDEDGWLKSYNTLLDTLLTIDEKQYSFGPQITYISKLLQAQAHSHESAMVSLQKIDTYTRLISKIAHTYTRFVNLSITTFQILDSEFIAEIESLDVEASQDVAYGAMRKTFHLMFIRIDEMSKDTPIINVTKSEEIKQILLEIVNLARKYTFITEKRREKRGMPQQLNRMQKCVKYTEEFKQCFMSLAGLFGQSVPGNTRGVELISDTPLICGIEV